jgi:hypothetical protein
MRVFTHRPPNPSDMQHKPCRCSECGLEAPATPDFDFFADSEDGLLRCEPCAASKRRGAGLIVEGFAEAGGVTVGTRTELREHSSTDTTTND